MTPLEQFKIDLGKYHIYEPHPEERHGRILIRLQKDINDFLNRNAQEFGLKNITFQWLENDGLTGCAEDYGSDSFIAITKGTFHFAYELITNVFKESTFLPNFLGISSDTPIIYSDIDFSSASWFIRQNNISSEAIIFKPNNYVRQILSESVIGNFLLYFLLHEIAHLRQKRKETTKNHPPIISQIRELDADLYATNKIGIRLISILKEQLSPRFTIAFTTETVCYFTIFIPLILFYMLDNGVANQYDSTETRHPHPALRARNAIACLTLLFIGNNFINPHELNKIGISVMRDFRKVFSQIAPNSRVADYYETMQNEDLKNHLYFLREQAKTISSLNGFGQY